MFTILSFDGGGVRGAYSIRLLERLEAHQPDLLQRVAMFAGTSTGGIIAGGLAMGMSVPEIRELYQKQAKTIFSRSFGRRIWGVRRFMAKYDNAGLLRVLQDAFGHTRLGDLPKRVLISSFDLRKQTRGAASYAPKFFHNFAINGGADATEKLVDVCMRTSAAPTYFPSYQGYVDGALAANNPSMCALAKARKSVADLMLDDVQLLSFGTGEVPTSIAGDRHDWGVVKWGFKILPMLMDGPVGVADYQCRQILKDNYCRLAPSLAKTVDLDDAASVDYLIDAADQVDLRPTLEWWRSHVG